MQGQTLSLTEAGKRILSDTSPMKALVQSSKYQTIEIKQEASTTPKIIRINGSSSGQTNSAGGQPRVIRLSSSQYNNLKLAGSGGKKVVIVSSGGANKVTTTPATPSTIKIVQVGNQPRKTIAIMPAAASNSSTTATTTSSIFSKMSTTTTAEDSNTDLKRQLAKLEEAAEK